MKLSFAFRAFFALLFGGNLPADIAEAFGYTKAPPVKATPAAPAPPPKPLSGPADGAVQILGILQREARLVDFLMEDLSAYSDEQVGSAVREVQLNARKTLERYLTLAPVIDGVEETVVKTAGVDKDALKLIGNVPASGKASSGVLRHKGWKAEKVDLPKSAPGMIVAPAELEIE